MQKKIPKYPIHGWLNIHKPLHMTSTQVVGAVKRLVRPQKVGHAGTLDPLADGVLPIALGEATKTVSYMMDAVKKYEFTITFGESRTTDDAEGEPLERSDKRPDRAELEAVLPQFMGEISQIPPIYSALKVQGKRAYDLARAGEVPELQARTVRIDALTLLDMPDASHATLEVVCGKGTYVRSLARDIAQALGTVGYVSALRRTQVGGFILKDAISLDFLEKIVHKADASVSSSGVKQVLLPLSVALDDILAIVIGSTDAQLLRQGRAIDALGENSSEMVAAYCDDELVAIGQYEQGLFKPKRVFNP